MGPARGQACGARGVRGVLAGLFVVSLAALFVSNAALLFDADCSSADDVSALRVQLSALKASSTAQLQLAQAELRASEALRAHLETSKAEAVPSRLSQRLSQRESQKPSQKQEAAPAGPQRRTHLAPKDVARAELLVRGQGRTKWSEGMDAGGWEWRHGEELDWTPEELASAQGFEDSACTILDTCCVGAMTGGSPRWRPGRCLANTALFEEEPRAPFQQRWAVELGVRGYAGGEPALGVLDVLHSMPDGLRVMLMGDSVMVGKKGERCRRQGPSSAPGVLSGEREHALLKLPLFSSNAPAPVLRQLPLRRTSAEQRWRALQEDVGANRPHPQRGKWHAHEAGGHPFRAGRRRGRQVGEKVPGHDGGAPRGLGLQRPLHQGGLHWRRRAGAELRHSLE